MKQPIAPRSDRRKSDRDGFSDVMNVRNDMGVPFESVTGSAPASELW